MVHYQHYELLVRSIRKIIRVETYNASNYKSPSDDLHQPKNIHEMKEVNL